MTTQVRQRLKYIVSDYVMTNIGWFLFNLVRFYSLPTGYSVWPLEAWLMDFNILLGQTIYPIVMVLLYALSGFYNETVIKSRADELGNTVLISFFGMLLIFFGTLVNDDIPERLQNYEMMGILWGMLTIPCYLGRLVITSVQRRRNRLGEGIYRSLIIGTGKEARYLAKRLDNRSYENLFNVVGFGRTGGSSGETEEGKAVYDIEDFEKVKEKEGIQAVILTTPLEAMSADVRFLSMLFRSGVDIYLTTDVYRTMMASPRITSVVSEPLINISKAHISAGTANVKRVSDILVSGLAMVCLSPLMAVLAIAVRMSSPGPIFYLQERIGYRKKPFKIVKFRTMYVDAEAEGPRLAQETDTRATKVGRIMRKYRLDELPQFWNVLKGEMSLVGPRPERQFYINEIEKRVPQYSLIHRVRPGVTSWGQVQYGYASTVEEMVERLKYDLLYIDNMSFGVDMKILYHTIMTVLRGRGR